RGDEGQARRWRAVAFRQDRAGTGGQGPRADEPLQYGGGHLFLRGLLPGTFRDGFSHLRSGTDGGSAAWFTTHPAAGWRHHQARHCRWAAARLVGAWRSEENRTTGLDTTL